MENPVYRYWQQYLKASKEENFNLKDWTFKMISHKYGLCLSVLNEIGSFPSSEPELKMLQFLWRG